MHGRISPRKSCNPCGNTMEISSGYLMLLIYDVKRTIKINGMGPFNSLLLQMSKFKKTRGRGNFELFVNTSERQTRNIKI